MATSNEKIVQVNYSADFRYRNFSCMAAIERQYLVFLNEILNKPFWWIKIHDESIVSRWKEELNGHIEAIRPANSLAAPRGGSDTSGSSSDSEENERSKDGRKMHHQSHNDGKENDDDVGDEEEDEEGNEEDLTGGDDGKDEEVEDEDNFEEEVEESIGEDKNDDDDDDESGYRSSETVDRSNAWACTLRTDTCFEYMMNELRDIAQCIESWPRPWPDDRRTSPISAHGVYIFDNLVSPEVSDCLKAAAEGLEEDLRLSDLSLSGNRQVVDLIHPSLHCLIYGQTCWSEVAGAAFGESRIQLGNKASLGAGASKKFQWLPSVFRVDGAGKVSIKSYINNLCPRKHSQMYDVICDVFESMLPLFELTLDALESIPKRRVLFDESSVTENKEEYYDRLWEEHKMKNDISDDDDDEVAKDDFIDNLADIDFDERVINYPSLPTSYKTTNWRAKSFNLRNKDLQVIVKMSTIHLTPENPTFKGGNWHLEGMENEAICATGIYYYDIDNITESRLSFRHLFHSDDFQYQQHDFRGLEEVYDIRSEVSRNIQPSGYLKAMQGRCVTFPNFHHHRVEPFELQDKTRDGYRQILCFFLVHPRWSIPSTRNIPRQEYEEVLYVLHRCFSSKLPESLLHLIASFLDCCLTKEEAKKYAEKLSEERKNVVKKDGHFNTQLIFFCEH